MNRDYEPAFFDNLDSAIGLGAKLFRDFLSSRKALSAILRRQGRARRTRERLGVCVPPLLIVSTTSLCNLSCKGCYSGGLNAARQDGLDKERVGEIIRESADIGVSVIMLAGGEPLIEKSWLYALGESRGQLGIVFTNGTLLDSAQALWLDKHRHIIPALSIEGTPAQTDLRRGEGVFSKVEDAMDLLRGNGLPYGLSITVTAENIGLVTSDAFAEEYINKGCRLFFFVEYVPVDEFTRPLVLTDEQKRMLADYSLKAQKKHSALFIPFPGSEAQYGGCLAAGRGFAHISAGGDMQPCPFAPYSDSSLKNMSLLEALSSETLRLIRENHHLLTESEGGCALWSNKEQVARILGQ